MAVLLAAFTAIGMLTAQPTAAAPRRSGQVREPVEAVEAVKKVFDMYIQSVNTADPAVGANVWSSGADVIAVTPFGRFTGWESVRNDIYVNFLQKSLLERKLQPSNLAIHAAGEVAWLSFDWEFTGKLADGQPITSKGWESQVYRRTPDGWRIVALHYSVPPPPPPR